MRIISVFLIFIYFAVAIRVRTFKVPVENVSSRDADSNGFVMKHAFVHFLKSSEVYRYDFVSDDQPQSRDLINWQNQKEKIQTLTKIMVMSYPPESIPVPGDYDNVTTYRQNAYKNIGFVLNSLNYTGDNIFYGERTDWSDEEQVGVQLYVWQHPGTGTVVFSYRGTYSTPDTYENLAWFGEQYAFYFPKSSMDYWEKWGNSRDDVESRNGMRAYYYLLGYDLIKGSIAEKLASQIADTTNLTKSEALDQGYYAVSKHIVETIYDEYKNGTIIIVGHSLGGAIAQTTSMWLAKKTGIPRETIIYGAYGSRCLSERFGDEIDYEADHSSYLTNYVTQYDTVAYIDKQMGKICYLPAADHARDACKKIMGLGIEILIGSANGAREAEWYRVCRIWAHSIFIYHDAVMNAAWLYDNGTTSIGCEIPDHSTCYPSNRDAGYAFFIIFNIILIVGSFAGIGIGIYALTRFIYLKATKKEGDIFFCSCCKKCCGCCCGPKVAV